MTATNAQPTDLEVRANRVLAGLPHDELEQLVERADIVDVKVRDPVFEPRAPIDVVHFPLTAIFSMVAVLEGQPAVEVSTVGREGMVGLPLFLGSRTSPNAAFCQVPGRSVRLRAEDFADLLASDGALHRRLHRFLEATLVQLSQNVACNRAHTTEQRASRWLLMTQVRVGADTFPLTQEFLAQMLGVRRATVTGVAASLRHAGLIRSSRGILTVVDRQGLEASACECYALVRDEFDLE